MFTVYIFYTMAFVGIFVLRHRQPDPAKRPFSVPLYPVIPLVALLGGLFVLISEVFNDPAGVLLFIGIVVVGLPIWALVKWLDKLRVNHNEQFKD